MHPRVPPELASFIEGLAEPRIVMGLDYRILAANRAYRERYCPQGTPVGKHCYEVSHGYSVPCDEAGESCPRAAALHSGKTQRFLHVHHTPRGEEHVHVELSLVRDASGEVACFVECMESVPGARASVSAEGLVGRSPAFVEMLGQIERVAATDTSVLLLGETGTGKDMVAKAIHDASRRANASFVAVECSGLSEALIESELFGHEKGAFTGAATCKTGLVEAASGGTLYLDEIGDIPLSRQVKLLRLIETRTYRRVGSVQPMHADFRLVAATHRDLAAMVREGTFRSDLYYRISAFPIHVPALRDRAEDIPLLAASLLSRIRPDRPVRVSDAARRMLVAYDFPGNARELRNILERAHLLSDDDVITPDELMPEVRRGAGTGTVAPVDRPSTAGSPLRVAERRALEQAVARHGGTRRALAQALGISERTLYRKLVEFGLLARR